MSDTLEIDKEQAALVIDFLEPPFLFNYDTELPRIGKVIDVLQRIESECKTYVTEFYTINRQYVDNTISPSVLSKKYKFMKLYNKIVIKPLLSVFETLIQNITTNTNQQYKGLQRFNAEVISSAIDLLSNFSYISEEFKQLVDKNNNLLMLYNRLVHFIIPITEEQTNTSQKSDENLMDTVDIPEYQSRTATPFRALEHLRNNLRWKKHILYTFFA